MPKSVRFYILLLSCFTIFSAAGIILADLDERANQVLLRVDPPKGLSPVEHGVSSPVPTPEIQLNSQSEKENEGNEGKNGKDKSKVQVVLGVMSQCPDAIYCESVFDDVLNQVGDIVDMKLTFIGR